MALGKFIILYFFFVIGFFSAGGTFAQLFSSGAIIIVAILGFAGSMIWLASIIIRSPIIRFFLIVASIFAGFVMGKSAPYAVNTMPRIVISENIPVLIKQEVFGKTKTGSITVKNIGTNLITSIKISCDINRINGSKFNETITYSVGGRIMPGETVFGLPITDTDANAKNLDINSLNCFATSAEFYENVKFDLFIDDIKYKDNFTYFRITNNEDFDISNIQVTCFDSNNRSYDAAYDVLENHTRDNGHTIKAKYTKEYKVSAKYMRLNNCKVTNAIKLAS